MTAMLRVRNFPLLLVGMGVCLALVVVGCSGSGPKLSEADVFQLVETYLDTQTYTERINTVADQLSYDADGNYVVLPVIYRTYPCSRKFPSWARVATWNPTEHVWKVGRYHKWLVYDATLIVKPVTTRTASAKC
jgi:hypothetical protein